MFRFRLQRVLELRERKERDAATAFVSAQEQVDVARAEEDRLMEARQALAARTTPSPNGVAAESIGALHTLHFLLGRLDERVAAATQSTNVAEQTANKRQDELRVAFRERHTLGKLRERHVESWRAAATATDRQQMDEIALSRFTQPGNQSKGGPSDGSQNSTHES